MTRKLVFIFFFGSIILNFFCPSGALGKIAIHPQNPHYMVDNGEAVVFFGSANIAPACPKYDYKAQLDARSAEGSNYGRVWTILPWEGTNTVFPWARSGSGTANDGGQKFNLDEWDSTYWQRLKDAVEHASTKNIYLQIMVFDECGLEGASNRWNQHPFNPNNNINNLSLPSGNTDAVPEFYDLGNSRVLAYQEAYVEKLLGETCQYDNVLYEVANETTAPWGWQKHFIDFIGQRCDSLIANNPFSYLTENLECEMLDIVNVHNLSAGSVNSWFVSRLNKNKILKYDEQALGSQTDSAIRHMGWATVLGGGHINWDESGNLTQVYLTTKMISKLFREQNVGFVDMEPHNELSDKGYALVNKGFQYIIYDPEGGTVTVNLSDVVGMANTKWYDPKTGEYSSEFVIQGGQEISLDPPFSGDVVLYIKKTDVDKTPPTAPQSLGGIAISESQIDLTWQPASDPESGISGYKVYRDDTFIGYSTTPSFSDPGLAENTIYVYEVSAVNGAGLESEKSAPISATTLAESIDTITPSIISATTSGDPNKVTVVFSEPVEEASSEDISNYGIDNDVTISGASLASDPNTVVLTTSPHTDVVTYMLNVNNIRDRASTPNVIAANTQITYTFAGQLVISNLTVDSGKAYEVIENGLQIGSLAYIDRSYTFSEVPASQLGATYIKTANADKGLTGDSFITFEVNQDVIVYIAHDNRIATKPSWMASFTDTGDDLVTTDATLSIFAKHVSAGTVTLGGNEGGDCSMYIAIIVAQGTPPPTAPSGLSLVSPE